MRDCYIRTGHGFVVTYSITNRDSYNEAEKFRARILLVKDDDEVPMVVLGNKCDLESERQVNYFILSYILSYILSFFLSSFLTFILTYFLSFFIPIKMMMKYLWSY